jgi:4-hydroxybenzoate polyprenyltransferase
MPFAMIGYFLGIHQPGFSFDFMLFIYILLCMIFARSAAMAFNRVVDLKYDIRNPRTINREIPAGKISVFATIVFIIFSSLLFITTTYFINQLVFYLSPIALFVIFLYSFTKRFTSLCHFVLGLGLALAPIGAYLSVTSFFSVLPIMFSVVVLLWVGGFDIIYALQDDDFDRNLNLHSIPVLLGRKHALILSRIIHFIAILIVITAGLYYPFGWLYWMGTVLFALMLLYEHYLVIPVDLSKVNMAFAVINGIAGLIFGLLTIASLYQ